MANNRKITVDDMMTIAQDMAQKNDARFFKNADAGTLAGKNEVGESDLTVALATKINGKVDSADLGDLAEKDEVAKTDLTTALKNEIEGKADAGTSLADYGITDAYTKTEIDAKFSSVYKAGGNVTFANLPVATDTTLGMVYNVTDAFTTTADFNEGAGKDYPANTNVAIVTPDNGATFKYDIFMGAIDLSNYAQLEDVETASAADITAICDEYYGS